MDKEIRLYIDMLKDEMETTISLLEITEPKSEQEAIEKILARAKYLDSVIHRLVITKEPQIIENVEKYFKEQQKLEKEINEMQRKLTEDTNSIIKKRNERLKNTEEMYEEIKKL